MLVLVARFSSFDAKLSKGDEQQWETRFSSLDFPRAPTGRQIIDKVTVPAAAGYPPTML